MRWKPIPETERAWIVQSVRLFLAGKIGVVEVARRLSRFHDEADPQIAEPFRVMVLVDDLSLALPTGEVRLLWNPTALEPMDRAIEDLEASYREEVTVACQKLAEILDDQQIAGRIDEVLLQEWDPLDVKDIPAGRHEYEPFIGGIYEMLRAGVPEHDITAHLLDLERETLQAGTDRERARRVARHLIEVGKRFEIKG